MKAIQARLAAIVASFLVATLASWGIDGLSTDSTAAIEKWVGHTFELMLFLGYAIIHPLLTRRSASTGASDPNGRVQE